MCHFESVKILDCYAVVMWLMRNEVTTVTHSIWYRKQRHWAEVPFTRYRTNFRPVEKFDRTFCSHGTIQYFCSLQTEMTNQDKF